MAVFQRVQRLAPYGGPPASEPLLTFPPPLCNLIGLAKPLERLMPVPTFQQIMLPFLKLLENGDELTYRDIIDQLTTVFELTEEEKRELLPSGRSKRYAVQ